MEPKAWAIVSRARVRSGIAARSKKQRERERARERERERGGLGHILGNGGWRCQLRINPDIFEDGKLLRTCSVVSQEMPGIYRLRNLVSPFFNIQKALERSILLHNSCHAGVPLGCTKFPAAYNPARRFLICSCLNHLVSTLCPFSAMAQPCFPCHFLIPLPT